MSRFSARNTIAWLGGAAGVVAVLGLQLGFFNGLVGALIVASGVIGLGYWASVTYARFAHARRLREFAQQHGWSFAESGYGLTSGVTGFPFDVGTGRRSEDVLQGAFDGIAAATFTYIYEHDLGDGKNIEQVFTVTSAQLPVPFPRLDLQPEDVGSRVLGAVTGADIDLESAEFNRTWRLTSANRRYAVDVVDPRMIELLLRNRIPGVSVRIEGTRVLAWSAGRARIGDLSRRLSLVTGIARRIPTHVVTTYTQADQQRRAEEDAREANAPTWAKTGGVLNSGRYTGIGVDADGDGVEDWEQGNR